MIRLIIIDVDGVLTDGTVLVGEAGEPTKRFHVHDGLGLKLAMQAGKIVALMTSAGSEGLLRRAEQLGIERVYQYVPEKGRAYEELRDELGLRDEEICYIGDDLIDLAPMTRAGLPVAVANAVDEVKAVARFVTTRPGGQGAVREVVERILNEEGVWGGIVARLAGGEAAPVNRSVDTP
ncbi:MAG: HAD-IIIA family hydrolase [Verrucomicrobia bacterium]|nr:HAD-IIIA family hydrolase [Verrucomicrobiota bacterium]